MSVLCLPIRQCGRPQRSPDLNASGHDSSNMSNSALDLNNQQQQQQQLQQQQQYAPYSDPHERREHSLSWEWDMSGGSSSGPSPFKGHEYPQVRM